MNGTNAVVTIDGGTYNGRLASVSGSKATTNLYTADTADKYDIGGTLIFNNGKVNGGDDAGVFIGYKAVVTINGGTVSSVKYPLSSNGTNEGKDYGEGILTINNGIVECSDSTAIYIPSNMTVAINGGKITGVSGIEFKAGAATVDLSVNGGFVKATGTNTTPNQTVDNGTSGWGEAITIIYSAAYGDSTDVTLAGGVFTSAVGKKAVGTYYYSETEITSQGEKVLSPVTGNTNFPKYVYEWVNNVPLNITGGTYSSAPADQLIESGYEYNSTTGIVAAK